MKGLCVFSALVVFLASPLYAVEVAPLVSSRHGVVACANGDAAAIGAAVLERGGTAIDAAVAVSFALGVVEPYGSGIWGEGYAMVRRPDGSIRAIDFRSRAPMAASFSALKAQGGKTSKLSKIIFGFCTPGLLAGMDSLWSHGGTLPWKELIEPSIKLARDGFVANRAFAEVKATNVEMLAQNAPAFLKPDGLAWLEGDKLTNPALADTLEIIAREGSGAFYEGAVGDRLLKFVAQHQGWLSLEDLALYEVIERKPIRSTYRDYEIIVPSGPVGGPRLVEKLNIFENYNVALWGWDSPLRLHMMNEAFLLSTADQDVYVGDPDYAYPMERAMVNKAFAARRAMSIDLSQAEPAGSKLFAGKKPENAMPYEITENLSEALLLSLPEAPQLEQERPEKKDTEGAATTHFVVADRWGTVVTVTQTISSLYGSGLWVGRAFLNNELTNFFSDDKEGMGQLLPGKRPRTTISPMFIEHRGKLVAALGTPGAARIVSTLAQVVSDMVDFGLSLSESLDRTKIYSSYRDHSKIDVEEGYRDTTLSSLSRFFGHKVKVRGASDLFFGGVNGIEAKEGLWVGVGSPRRGGMAAAAER